MNVSPIFPPTKDALFPTHLAAVETPFAIPLPAFTNGEATTPPAFLKNCPVAVRPVLIPPPIAPKKCLMCACCFAEISFASSTIPFFLPSSPACSPAFLPSSAACSPAFLPSSAACSPAFLPSSACSSPAFLPSSPTCWPASSAIFSPASSIASPTGVSVRSVTPLSIVCSIISPACSSTCSATSAPACSAGLPSPSSSISSLS